MMRRCQQWTREIWARMSQRKHVDMEDTSTRLKRCLTLKRLTFIGVGKTVGVGIYVLIGIATKEAGPGVIVSFLLAFVVTLLNGLCFAEYASKNPKTGAQYSYMYETIGEAFAFIVGWTSTIGFVAALSMASRGWSGYLDSLFNHTIQNYTLTHIANWTSIGPPFPEFPDLPAILIILVAMVIVSVGVNFASIINSFLTAVAAGLLVFISVCGFTFANTDNWLKVPGGFFPHGLNGVLKASSSCFYAFQGFEILGYSAEETLNPKKDVPRSIVLVLLTVTVLYISVAVSFTLMVPYTSINTHAPFPGAFEYNSVTWAKYLVEIGPILALTNLVVMELFTVQRLSFSMSEDGLLFRCLSRVNRYTKVPLGPVLAFGPIGIVLVLSIDLSNLISFMVIFAFVQYSLFAAYLIILRYNPVTKDTIKGETLIENSKPSVPADPYTVKSNMRTSAVAGKLKNCVIFRVTDFLSVKILAVLLYCCCFVLAWLIVNEGARISAGNAALSTVLVVLMLIVALGMMLIWSREQAGDRRGFLVPLMPLLPLTSMFCNQIMLVSVVDKGSLVAAVVMATIGVAIYFAIVIYDVTIKRKPRLEPGDSNEYADQVRLLSEEQELDVESTH